MKNSTKSIIAEAMNTPKTLRTTLFSGISVQIPMPNSLSWKVNSWTSSHLDQKDEIPNELKYRAHITLVYGSGDVGFDKIKKIASKIEPFTLKFSGLSSFNSEEHDVLFQSVELNDSLQKAYDLFFKDVEQKYPTYHPHLTLSYLYPGKAKSYTDMAGPLDHETVEVNTLFFTDLDGNVMELPLKRKQANLNESKTGPVALELYHTTSAEAASKILTDGFSLKTYGKIWKKWPHMHQGRPKGIYFVQEDGYKYEFSPRNPYDGVSNGVRIYAKVTLDNPKYVKNTTDLAQEYGDKWNSALTSALKGDGYDGVITDSEIIVFDIHKIKIDYKKTLAEAKRLGVVLKGHSSPVMPFNPDKNKEILENGVPFCLVPKGDHGLVAGMTVTCGGDLFLNSRCVSPTHLVKSEFVIPVLSGGNRTRASVFMESHFDELDHVASSISQKSKLSGWIYKNQVLLVHSVNEVTPSLVHQYLPSVTHIWPILPSWKKLKENYRNIDLSHKQVKGPRESYLPVCIDTSHLPRHSGNLYNAFELPRIGILENKELFFVENDGGCSQVVLVHESDVPKIKHLMRQKADRLDEKVSQLAVKQNSKIPSFDSIWSQLKETSAAQDQIELYEIHSDRWESKFEKEFGKSIHDVDDSVLKSWILENEVRTEAEHNYNEVVRQYLQLNGKKCWRMITLSPEEDPRKLEKTGRFWSTEKDAAYPHNGGFHKGEKKKVLFEGLVDLKNVDWEMTLLARLDFNLGELEKEITLIPGSKVFILGIQDNHKWHNVNKWLVV